LDISDKRTASRLDRAYACYGFLGLAILTTAALMALAGNDHNSQLGVFLFSLIPLSLAGLGAFAYAVVLTIMLRRFPLVLLNVTLLFFIAVVIALAADAEPEPRPFNALAWDPNTPCSTNWTRQQDLFIKSDGSKVSGCIEIEDIRQAGRVLPLRDPDLRLNPDFQPPPPIVRQPHKGLRRSGIALAYLLPSVDVLIPAWWFGVGRRRYRSREALRQ